MSKYYLFQDQTKCIGCHACEIACQLNKDLPTEPKPTEIIHVGPRWVGNIPRTSHIFVACFHCEEPWCVAACPTGALQIRRNDGLVYVQFDLCIGCKACMAACPWGAPQWHPEIGKAVKCDYCMYRIEEGLQPACVTVCPTRCIHFGTPDELPHVKRERHALTYVQGRLL